MTRRRLKEALLDLIQEQSYDTITIEDITARADVGRSTFYSHFDSKEDLLFAGFDHWLLSLAESAPLAQDRSSPGGGRVQFRFSLPFLQHVRSQKRFFEAIIVGTSDVRIRRKTTALLVQTVQREMARGASVPRHGAVGSGAAAEARMMRDAQAHGVVGAFLGLVAWWLDAGRQLDAESIDRVFQDMVRGDVVA
jgi:AcrR family transcriptional regulator